VYIRRSVYPLSSSFENPELLPVTFCFADAVLCYYSRIDTYKQAVFIGFET
jgi:hypothetical protein